MREILGRGYHAVVGNPPYIAVQDAALRNAYRARYESCHGKYVLTVPFMERFFELAKERGGFVGKITGNSFMKREFGAPLVERFLRSVDIQTVIDIAGRVLRVPRRGPAQTSPHARPKHLEVEEAEAEAEARHR